MNFYGITCDARECSEGADRVTLHANYLPLYWCHWHYRQHAHRLEHFEIKPL